MNSSKLSCRHQDALKKNCLFCMRVQPINNVVTVSGEQEGLSHTYTCIHSPPNSSIQAAI